MGIAIGDVNAFMSHSVSDCYSRKAHFNQQ